MRKVLVTGGGGMLARDLRAVLGARAGEFQVVAPAHGQLDVTNADHVRGVMASFRPAIVFNCAAFTKVDLCETDPAARAVNADAVATIAGACAKAGARLVHVSTDFVFDGRKGTPYVEEDRPAPLSAYGRTKREGEERALEAPGALVVRASWLFGSHGPNFVEAMLKQAESGKKEVRVVSDQVGRPTATTDLAEALVALADANASGIVHYANRGEVSWNEFAREIYRRAGFADVEVRPITSAELDRPAIRPAYSVLSTEKYERLTGTTPRDFREPLAEYLARRARP
ncbi:MAG TPA: dTDP-4-dehydrorhamnose reductase [Thermoanaerobaculia bacterium]|nr:dTDP-4-dehydrorhamnose reductase [Thermoanaerobaculia bacterium]